MSAVLVCVGVVQLGLVLVAIASGGVAGRWTGVLGCALAYDSLVVGLGAALGEGALLEGLNEGRFVAHALLTPLAVVCGALLAGAGRRASAAAWAAALALAAVGAATGLPGLDLEPRRWAGTLRYVEAGGHGAPVAAVLAMLVLLGVGAAVWVRRSVPWIALGALAVFVASALAVVAPPLGNLGEALMLAGMVAALRDGRTRRAVPAVPQAPPRAG
ncbi:hypothetical protein [Streptomyces sp. NPDC003247]|uniref:hypothetical protein n=1 Tax=Streptomyces sp. NPDC003247 TaxID=3364677 RepID=UPI00367E0CCC